MTPDEIAFCEWVLHKWEHEWDETLETHIERVAEEMGCTCRVLVMDCQDLLLQEPDRIMGRISVIEISCHASGTLSTPA
ncbi:MAG: hypothetical protein P0111_03970 [Nitrospira sp.]|nr:hypothetical protein [Nitrospira sp.]